MKLDGELAMQLVHCVLPVGIVDQWPSFSSAVVEAVEGE